MKRLKTIDMDSGEVEYIELNGKCWFCAERDPFNHKGLCKECDEVLLDE